MPQVVGVGLLLLAFGWDEEAGDLFGGVGVEGGGDVAVSVEGDGDAAVAETFGDDFRVYAVGQRQRCPGVAKVVEADPRQTSGFGEFGESSADPWRRYRHTGAGEHEIVVGVLRVFAELGFECCRAVVAQRGGGGGVELHGPGRSLCFRFTEHSNPFHSDEGLDD